MDNNLVTQDKIRGCILGGAIGDALGYQIEFKRGIRDKQVTRFKDGFGIISDDTQMTLFTATSLIRHATMSHLHQQHPILANRDVYDGYLDWLDTQKRSRDHDSISWIKDIPELNKSRAPGNTCLSALCSGRMGTVESPVNNSSGCGSVMRIAPCGIFSDSPQNAGRLAAECAVITHGHKSGLIASYVCSSMINALICDNLSIEQALENSMNLIENDHTLYTDRRRVFQPSSMSTFKDLVNKAIELSKQDISDTSAIRLLGEGWVADEAFVIALYSCLKYSNSFEDAIVCAVNHDGDSDSTGAIVGNIMGAALGLDNIPQYYVDNVELKDVIFEIADDLYTARTDASVMQCESWVRKYVNCENITH